MKYHIITVGVLTIFQTATFVYYILKQRTKEDSKQNSIKDTEETIVKEIESPQQEGARIDVVLLKDKRKELKKLRDIVLELDARLECVREKLESASKK